jgi:hypothetical protein
MVEEGAKEEEENPFVAKAPEEDTTANCPIVNGVVEARPPEEQGEKE